MTKKEEYTKNPKKCNECGCSLGWDKRRNKFCSSSCSATHSNQRRLITYRKHDKKKTCLFCKNEYNTKHKDSKWCSNNCHHDWMREEKIKNGTASHIAVKTFLIKKHGASCMECGWDRINEHTGKVPIELEHIDGNSHNNTLENVKLLCPNCHSLTPTYKALNKGNGRYKRRQRYQEGKSF